MPDGAAAVAGGGAGMAPDPNVVCRKISTSRGRGRGAGRDGQGRRQRPGRAVPAENAVGLTPLVLVAAGREWVEAGDAAMMGLEVRGRALAGAAGRVVLIRAEISVRKARAGDADTR